MLKEGRGREGKERGAVGGWRRAHGVKEDGRGVCSGCKLWP